MLDGCDPGVLETIVASGWLERFKDDGPLAREAALAASLARENSGDFSAVGPDRLGGTSGASSGQPAVPVPPRPSEPTLRGSDVIGSPEWQVARAKWLKERDERVARERMQKIQERLDRDEDLRQRRAAAAARNRWLEAGQCQY